MSTHLDPTESPDDEKTLVFEDGTLAKGFTIIPNTILRNPALSLQSRHLYSLLLSYAWQDNECFPGQARLATDAGCSERQVQNLLGHLIAAGLITTRRRGLGKTNVYTICRWEGFAKPTDPDTKPSSYQEAKPSSHYEYSGYEDTCTKPDVARDARAMKGREKGREIPFTEPPEPEESPSVATYSNPLEVAPPDPEFLRKESEEVSRRQARRRELLEPVWREFQKQFPPSARKPMGLNQNEFTREVLDEFFDWLQEGYPVQKAVAVVAASIRDYDPAQDTRHAPTINHFHHPALYAAMRRSYSKWQADQPQRHHVVGEAVETLAETKERYARHLVLCQERAAREKAEEERKHAEAAAYASKHHIRIRHGRTYEEMLEWKKQQA